MAAGAVHTPAILQVSGVGPKWFSDAIGVTSQIDIDGVGYNFQDHPMYYTNFQCTTTVSSEGDIC